MIWDKHASTVGTLLLFLCLAGGAAYQQAPMRSAVGGGGAALTAVSSGEGKRTDGEPEPVAAVELAVAAAAERAKETGGIVVEDIMKGPAPDASEPTPPRIRVGNAGLN